MRIASLLPSATELLFAVGAGPEVVGVTHECDFPAEAARLPRLTASSIDHTGQSCAAIDRHIRGALHGGSSIYRLDEELLAGLRPNLIVTQELCEVCAVAYGEVEEAARRLAGEVPVISLEPESLEGILATAVIVGRAARHRREAEALVERLRAGIDAVEALPPCDGGPPATACLEWTDPVFAGGHWVPEMVRRAGGRDVLGAEGERSAEVPWERVVDAAPEVMVLMPCGFGLERSLETVADLRERPGFAGLPAVRSGRVAAVDGSGYFNRPGPRIVEGLRILAAILRGEPGSPLPSGAAWIP
ncbi:MAG TPA: cobalamin-binding protein [Candidatus Dormibacteraeota bacterium]|nr:cobalamin-binding protein [Candidatus Dormibacteraeota bacterium]